MKVVNFFLAALVVALAFNTSYALVGDNFDEFQSDGVESNLTVTFGNECRWVEVYEGGSGGGCIDGYLRINILDEGLGTLPHVVVYNNSQVFMEFDMVEDEVAKVLIRDQENGTLLKRIRIRDMQQDNFFSKAKIIVYEPDCDIQSVPAVQPIGNNPYLGAIFTKLDTCQQKILLM